ncbi:DUF1285 domain-containing protein [Seongchinamella sediminis]|uniref:DUF1285 domain-containing protein n=1 Tax=Seongchinamella sediminis TaxID=2283635 RepID=A0A3L7E272_9GAMM|nr:DUF1285 domain-containing protein [Seongchinamella sediminis]RLQ23109.1 DUF1285 domain-containing protein [Seongchinamella sediminis]
MTDKLDAIADQVGKRRNFDSPPLHLWNPELSGDIPIRIARDGSWYHEDSLIRRESLRNLFASILRREDDGEYYLVTPVEKWRLQVEAHPLIVTDVEPVDAELQLTLNTGKTLLVGEEHPLFLDPDIDNVAAVRLWHGLTALFSRNAWYRLVELADSEGVVHSGATSLRLG